MTPGKNRATTARVSRYICIYSCLVLSMLVTQGRGAPHQTLTAFLLLPVSDPAVATASAFVAAAAAAFCCLLLLAMLLPTHPKLRTCPLTLSFSHPVPLGSTPPPHPTPPCPLLLLLLSMQPASCPMTSAATSG
jgi:hypothetical protein